MRLHVWKNYERHWQELMTYDWPSASHPTLKMNTEMTVIFPTPTFQLVLRVQLTGALLIFSVHLFENFRFFQRSSQSL